MLLAALLLPLAGGVCAQQHSQGAASARHARILFHGRDSSVGYMSRWQDELALDLAALDLEAVAAEGARAVPEADLVVFLWGANPRGGGRGGRGRGVRAGGGASPAVSADAGQAEALAVALDTLLAREPAPQIVATPAVFTELAALRPQLVERELLVSDALLDAYLEVGADRSNLRRLLEHLGVTFLDREGLAPAPLADVGQTGLYHPEHPEPFADVQAFLAWAADSDALPFDAQHAPRALLTTVSHHFALRNHDAVDALIRALGERGVLAVAHLVGQGESSEALYASFAPDVVLDTRHVVPRDEDRAAADVPFLQCATLLRRSVEDWHADTMSGRPLMGLEAAELAGSIEARVFNGARASEGPEIFGPIPERVERIADRASAWIELARAAPAERRVAFVAGFGGGTPDNQLLDVARSLLELLRALQSEGYAVHDLPVDARALSELWEQRAWDGSAAELERLARSGSVSLVPAGVYRAWYERRVPAAQRAQLEARFGPPPGNWGVWRDERGDAHLVVPTLAFGAATLVGGTGLPPGVDEDMAAIHARRAEHAGLIPSHSVLVSRFFAEESLRAHAVVRFGSFDAQLLMPRRVVGLGADDWPEILAGTLPDIRPFSMASTTFAVPARRRAGALLIGHLTPPLSEAGLDSALLDLRDDLLKWSGLPEGALKQRFAASISERVRTERLDRDLQIELAPEQWLDDAQMAALSVLLGELRGELVSGAAHVLGRPPDPLTLAPQLLTAAGTDFLEALNTVLGPLIDPGALAGAEASSGTGSSSSEVALPGDLARAERERALACLNAMLRADLSALDALRSVGASLPDNDATASAALPDALTAGFELITQMRAGYARTGNEIDNLLAALDGRRVPPGPSGTPERNPAALPSGRSLYFFDPEQIPSEASWELGLSLTDSLLEGLLAENGRYPRKVAVSLSTRSSMYDHGVSEAQALALLGVRPVRARGRVTDVEVIPREELGRPRIDVFLESKHFYNDTFESRAILLDRAVQLVVALDEPDNFVRENRERARAELLAAGMADERAEILSRARIFAVPQGHFGSGLHDGLFGDTGVWDTRGDLAEVYMSQHDHVFTAGAWSEKAPAAYRAQLVDTEVVLRGSANHGALSGRAHASGASLANAVEHVSGEAPAYYIADMRRPGDEVVLPAAEMLRRDLRALLFNDNWISEMQAEGRHGAQRMAALSWKVFAWKINRPQSVDDGTFEQIAEVYLEDSKGLRLPEFFEQHSPGSLQAITKNLLEAARHEMWTTSPARLAQLATLHAESVTRHGPLIDANPRLESFVDAALRAAPDAHHAALATAYAEAVSDAPPATVARDAAPSALASAPVSTPPQAAPATAPPTAPPTAPSTPSTPPSTLAARAEPAPFVQGRELVPRDEAAAASSSTRWLVSLALLVLVACAALGAARRGGAA
ncbi:MAG: magnesium chelatase subunit H [Planctomycetota bacterium]|nr:MAG: magnesium chelatase subunit H [Planctomycetota bacterium]